MKNRFINTAVLLVIVFSACEKVIPFEEVVGDHHLVVNSLLVADSVFEVQVFNSKLISDENYEPSYLNDATVIIFEDGNEVETLPFVENGYYRSSLNTAKTGCDYRVQVNDTQGKTAYGTTQVLEPVTILSVDSVGMSENSWGDEMMVLQVKLKDNSDQKDYYRIVIRQYRKDYYYDPDYVGIADSAIVLSDMYLKSNDPAVSAIVDGMVYFSDALFNGKEYAFEVLMDYFGYNALTPYYYVYLEHISYDFYRYNVALEGHYEAEDWSFFMEAVLVYNNITNGLGIVGSSSASVDSIYNYQYGLEYSYK